MFVVVIRSVSNGNNMVLAPKQLQASYTDKWHWEELIDFIDINGGSKEQYIVTSMFLCPMEQEELDKKYMWLYINRQPLMDPIYDQISYDWCLSNAFQFKQEHNPKIFLFEIMSATGKEIVEHVIRPATVFPANYVKARCAQLPIIIHWL